MTDETSEYVKKGKALRAAARTARRRLEAHDRKRLALQSDLNNAIAGLWDALNEQGRRSAERRELMFGTQTAEEKQ